jgi:hypothetical protein
VNRIILTPIAAAGASLGPRMTIYLVRPFLPVIILVNINGPLYRGIRRLTYHFKYSLVKAIRDGTPSVRLSGAFMMFKYLHSFIRDEVEFRWSGNKVFLPGTVNNTVGVVFKEYLTGDMALYYSMNEPKAKKTGMKNQLTMALELYIDKPAVCFPSFLHFIAAFNSSTVIVTVSYSAGH